MLSSHQKRKKRMISEINVVPYIDVMLVLLIIFMVTAPLLTTGVEVDLPSSSADHGLDPGQEPFIVTVDSDGRLYLNSEREEVASGREVEIKARTVLRKNPNTPFLVKGDGAAQYYQVVKAMALLQQAGVESVGLITDPPEQEVRNEG